jgi:hypothetical protein
MRLLDFLVFFFVPLLLGAPWWAALAIGLIAMADIW